ncbi:hypothetical protein SAY87_008564 [Trapa incisa]|uniref:Uncharacterized protein n=1 Tax=Trapa incisa TaxID=236973 RepID=A0AAN7JXG8_9MYRT|nr:hypothetical protein SAY87_008564 [Trapa incisa]
MFSPKKLVKMATVGRRRVPPSSSSSTIAEKGHFVVYTVDGRRFEMPLSYLHSRIFHELFRMSEEEFGLSSEGPITLPCEASFMEYAVSLIQRGAGEDLEEALLSSVSSAQCTGRLR